MATVLVVEDERDIRELLRRFLERAGCSVLTAQTGAEALRFLNGSQVDLVLLDLGLPDIDGTDILREVSRRIPVIVLTARSDIQERIAGLRLGADDYVVKPFSPTEVVLRVQAVLSRGDGRAPEGAVRTYGDRLLTVDSRRRVATVRGRDLQLTVTEWDLLAALAHSPGRVLTRAELVNRVRGQEFAGYERAIDSHVKNLRHKLDDDDHHVVETVVGVGYRFGLPADG
ncbi:MAG TPA: response regulator transcription factor [Ornithinibacter sp.]|nr:response regulator transcription factor [Ornithinibacter sp.]